MTDEQELRTAAISSSWDRIRRLAADRDLDAVMLFSPQMVRYTLGIRHETNFDSPWGPGPAVCLVPRSGAVVGMVPNGLHSAQVSVGIDLRRYDAYSWEQRPDPLRALVGLMSDVIAELGLTRGRVGIELRAVYAALELLMAGAIPHAGFVDVSEPLVALTSVKTVAELALIRKAAAASAVGQAIARTRIRPGMSELEALAVVREGIESSQGHPLEGFVADLLSGPRTAEPGQASSRTVRVGDPILCDLVVCVDGYWGDTTATFVVGIPSDELSAVHSLVSEALKVATEQVMPGTPASQIDRVVREFLKSRGFDCRHHIGHGVGLTYHEEPLLGPHNSLPLEVGMVLALEPGVYRQGNFGFRLEDTIIVTADGPEVVSKHSKVLTADLGY